MTRVSQAKDSYNTALEKDPSDPDAKEGLAVLQTVSANLEQGYPPPPPKLELCRFREICRH
jgi:hypothetical protein